MKIKILKDEYIFSSRGTHICDDKGFAIQAQEDQELSIDDDCSEKVASLLSQERAMRGLMPDGSEPVIEELKVPKDLIDVLPAQDAGSDVSPDSPSA